MEWNKILEIFYAFCTENYEISKIDLLYWHQQIIIQEKSQYFQNYFQQYIDFPNQEKLVFCR